MILIKKSLAANVLDYDQVEGVLNRALLHHKKNTMKTILQIIIAFLLINAVISTARAQTKLSKREFSLNAFRNPSIGLEYRYQSVSIHAGYYSTAFASGEYTNFIKTGFTYWFLPVGKRENSSSFYSSVSYARGLTRDYENKSAAMGEVGFRWMIWKGLNLRMGVAVLAAKNESLKINPTPGISYSFFFK